MSTLSRERGRAAVGPYVGVGLGGLLTAVGVGALVVASFAGAGVRPGAFLEPEAAKGFSRLARGLYPPTSRRTFCAARWG